MRCTWCDSEYTFYGGERISFDEMFVKLDEFGCRLVEVTGGEPLAQKNVFPFIRELCDRGYEVLVETGGYISTENVDPRASIILDVKCPASGEAERNHWPNLERLRPEKDEVKFVIANLQDWEFAKEIIRKYDKRVQDGNAYFTSYVEGWKTDRGMIYLIYGAPNVIYKTANSETWTYGEENNINSLTYVFSKVNNPFTDNDYSLDRSPNYKQAWYSAVDIWRQGRAYLQD